MTGADIGAELHRRQGAQQHARDQIEAMRVDVDRLEAEWVLLDQVIEQMAGIQEVLKVHIETSVGSVVSRGLSAVFGEDLELVVDLGFHGNTASVKFSIRDGRGLETGILDARGGGVVNVVSFLLQLWVQIKVRPVLSRLVCLDETFANVDEEHLGAVVRLLREVAEEGGFQFIIITHRPQLAAAGDVVYQLSQKEGRTQVRAVDDGQLTPLVIAGAVEELELESE